MVDRRIISGSNIDPYRRRSSSPLEKSSEFWTAPSIKSWVYMSLVKQSLHVECDRNSFSSGARKIRMLDDMLVINFSWFRILRIVTLSTYRYSTQSNYAREKPVLDKIEEKSMLMAIDNLPKQKCRQFLCKSNQYNY